MPYRIAEHGDQFCVMKGDEELKCYNVKQDALDYLGALEANVEDANKSLSTMKSLADNRVGGYLVVFGDQKTKDLSGEYFTADTNYHLDWFKERPFLYHHGMHKNIKAVPVGMIDTIRKDEIGLWAEAELDIKAFDIQQFTQEELIERMKYIEAVRGLVKKGALNFSSGSIGHLVEIASDGMIKEWPIVEGSGTASPAEPRRTDIGFVKSIYTDIGKSDILDSIEHLTVGRTEATELKGVKNETLTPQKYLSLPTKGSHMDMEQIKKVLRELLSSLDESDSMVEEDAMQMGEKAVSDLPEDAQKSLSEDQIIAIATKAVQGAFEKRDARNAKIKAQADAIKAAQKKASPPNDSDYAPAATKSLDGKKPTRVTDMEMREYAGLSGDEMLLGIKLATSGLPEYARKGLKLQDLVDKGIFEESYIKTALHKASAGLENWQAPDSTDTAAVNDYAAVKSMRWLKADELLATDITNQGAELVEFLYDTQLWRRVRDRTELFNRLSTKGMRIKDVPLGAKGMNVKYDTTGATVYTLSEANSVDATNNPESVVNYSQLSTDEREVPLGTHIIAEGVTFQLQQRSIIDIISEVQFDMMEALSESLESALINGDTATSANTNINKIDGTPATGIQKPDYLIWDGLRKQALASASTYTDNAAAALDALDYEEVRALFPLKFRTRKANMLFIIDESVESATRKLAEHFTTGVAGERATFFTGDVSLLAGYDVYTSGFLALSNTNGKISVTPGNNTQGQILGVFAPYWQYGRQLRINIEMERRPTSQATVFVATANHGFAARSAYASVMMYDITV